MQAEPTHMNQTDTVKIMVRMNEILNKISDINNAIKYRIFNGDELSLLIDDKRELQSEYDKLKLELCDYDKL